MTKNHLYTYNFCIRKWLISMYKILQNYSWLFQYYKWSPRNFAFTMKSSFWHLLLHFLSLDIYIFCSKHANCSITFVFDIDNTYKDVFNIPLKWNVTSLGTKEKVICTGFYNFLLKTMSKLETKYYFWWVLTSFK